MSSVLGKDFAEFFAGIGLMRIGLERAGWHISFANDIEEDKWRMYRDNFGDTGGSFSTALAATCHRNDPPCTGDLKKPKRF